MLKFIKNSPTGGYAYYDCTCGHIKEIRKSHVDAGKTKSCGCLHRKSASERAHNLHAARRTHGLSHSNTYSTWSGMKARCTDKNNKFFHYYGGRGIYVCERWQKFENFLADMGEKPSKHYSVDRINNDGPYSPENCRWATRSEQQSNRRVNRRIFFNGENLTVMQWSSRLGIAPQTIYQRLDLGWPPDKILLPEKQIDKSGLALGGIANGARNKAKTHCKNDHEFTAENTRRNGKNGRACLKCHAIREAKRRETKRHATLPETKA